MSKPVTTNDDQQLYVIPAGSGYSCWGYENAFRDTEALARKLGEALPDRADFGTMAIYERHRELLRLVGDRKVDLGTWFTPGTVPEVERVLTSVIGSDHRVAITYGDSATGRAWSDDAERGTISRSMGPIKVPILLRTGRSLGGGAILTDCIVRIQESRGGRDLYRHPAFHVAPTMTREEIEPGTAAPALG